LKKKFTTKAGYVNIITQEFDGTLGLPMEKPSYLPEDYIGPLPGALESAKTGAASVTPVGKSTVVAKSRPKGRALKFVKEWGGVATVLIAILYTFPFDAAGKFMNWREQSLLDARKALTEVAALYATQTSALAAIQDPAARSFLSGTYQIRIYNELLQNKAAINGAAKDLLSSELYMVAGLYTLSGFPDGLPYYKLALAKAPSDGERATIYRELGNALFSPGPIQNVPDARDAYVHALKISSSVSYLEPNYAWFVTELGRFEMVFGDWKCGQQLTSYGLPLLQLVAAGANANQGTRDTASFFQSSVAALVRGPNQPAEGCAYSIPLLPGASATITTSPGLSHKTN
jgi:hypothetical protein